MEKSETAQPWRYGREYEQDYGVAVEEGRKAAQSDRTVSLLMTRIPARCSLGIPSRPAS